MTRVKICGLTRIEDAVLAAEFGAQAVGFILEPTSPRYIKDIGALRSSFPCLGPYVTRVAVYGPMPDSVETKGFQAVQGIGASSHVRHGQAINVVRVTAGTTEEDLTEACAGAAAVLLDAHAETGYGGTGHKLDWDQAASLVQGLEIPVILAGGLTPDNVRDAIEKVRPYAVDVSSGVEASPGIKDAYKLKDFFQAVKS